ncbi:uncharacterized protein [Argopecten irradians]|uniref:uncharacterized protein n=1 Tax=Argopecten irradians TaxID=31199 RepID=UPI00371C3277
MSTSVLEATQNVYEQRFNCIVCLSPRLKMVYGLCQHRVCEECLYSDGVVLRHSFRKCPTCLKENTFPLIRPDLPEDNIEHQKCLGVRACPHKGCTMEMWEWEMESHLVVCPNRVQPKDAKRKRKSIINVQSESKNRLKSRPISKTALTRVLRSKSVSVRDRVTSNRRTPRRTRHSTNVL